MEFGISNTYAKHEANSTVHDISRDRNKQGRCSDCGIQTHITKSLGRSSIPINNEYVLNGRCLACKPLGTSAAPAGASVGTILYHQAELAQAVGLQDQDEVLNDVPPVPMGVQDSVESTTEADNAPPAVSTDHGQHSDIEGGNGEPSAVLSVLDSWRRKPRWVWVVGGVLVFIFVVVVAIPVSLSSQNDDSVLANPPTPPPTLAITPPTNGPTPATPSPTLAITPPTNGPTPATPSPTWKFNLSPTALLQSSALELIPSEGIVSHTRLSTKNVVIYNGTAIVGAPDNDNKRGSVFVHAKDENGEWSQQANLVAPDGVAGNFFGNSVALFGDTMIVGSPFDDDNGLNSGSANIYVRNGVTWSHQAKLLAPDVAIYDDFGWSVAIYGNTALVGARAPNSERRGSAHVFVRDGVTWSHQKKLLAPDGTARDYFATSVAIDGNTAIVGAYKDTDNGMDSGSVHIYVRNGVTWSYQKKLLAPDSATYDYFGISVAIDGNTAIVGAYRDDDNGEESGSAHVYVRNGVTWSHQAKLVAPDGAANDYFGTSVAIDGNTAIIGAPGEESGSAHVYVRNGVTWSPYAKLLAPKSGVRFGRSVGIYDGTIIGGSKSGEAYVFGG